MSLFSPHLVVIKRLLALVAPGGHEKDEKWKEKAIKSLVKKLKKTNQLSVLERAIGFKDSSTQCITIPRSLDGRLQIGPKKGWPHVFYCQLWRWPDLTSQHELRPIPTCEYSFHVKRSEVCVNPYHYIRVENPSILVPSGLPARARAGVGESSTSRLNDDFRALRLPTFQSTVAPPLKMIGNENGSISGHNSLTRASVSSDATPSPHTANRGDALFFTNSTGVTSNSNESWSPKGDSGSTHSISTVTGGDLIANSAQMSTPSFSPFQHDVITSQSSNDEHSVFNEDGMDAHFDNYGMEMTLSERTIHSEVEDDNNMDLVDAPYYECRPDQLERNDVGSNSALVYSNYSGSCASSLGDNLSTTESVSANGNSNSTTTSTTNTKYNANASSAVTDSPSACLTPVDYHVLENWCSVLYYEYNLHVGDTFHCSSPHLTVDGYTHPNRSDRFCLGVLSNVKRDQEAEVTRRHIGRGLTLFYLGGEVLVECIGDYPIFVQSPNCNHMNSWHPATVVRVPPGSNLTIFNNMIFAELLKSSVHHGYDAAYELGKMCIFRISFVKGWGEAYKRPSITMTPCWIEIHLNGPLQWLDRVLQKMGCPTKQCSSFS